MPKRAKQHSEKAPRIRQDDWYANLLKCQRWRECSKRYLGFKIYCERCGKPAEVSHHKVSPRENVSLTFDHNNLEALCRSCHIRHHNNERRKT